MCNGSLKSIFQNDDFFKLLVINRIFIGIDYIHSNKLIHRDIKHSSILFDHDYLPYKLVVIFAFNSIFNLLLKTNNYLFQN